jgi:hypothetical protein
LEIWPTSHQRGFLESEETATQALKIDDRFAEAYGSPCYVDWSIGWNWVAAEQKYQKAISHNHGYATAHQWYALCLA